MALFMCSFYKNCKAKVEVENGVCRRKIDLKTSWLDQQHNHGSMEAEIAEIKFSSTVKEKCRNATISSVQSGSGSVAVGNVRHMYDSVVRK